MTSLSPSAPAERPGPVAVWLHTIRPKTLPAGAVPVFVGTALAAADGALRPLPALAALAGALLLQIGCNLANDASDFLNGADGEDRLGPARAAQKGWLGVRQVVAGAGVTLGLALLVGIYLAGVGGWPIVAIGVAGLASAVAYTAGPVPLGYVGLGDPLVLAFFGPAAVGGTYLVQAGHVPAHVWLASLPVGLLATAILVVNNLRDRHTDARAGKRTLAVRLGARGARIEYALLLLVSFAVPPAVVAAGLGGPGWLLPLLAIPVAWRRWRTVATTDGAALNPELGGTARLELIFGLLLGAGVLL
ncbi:MAG: 1,4-dihydroxy-2-naphthoate polyprenyltransferase [Myxococcota bacterium]